MFLRVSTLAEIVRLPPNRGIWKLIVRVLNGNGKKSIENIWGEILFHASEKMLQMFEDKASHKNPRNLTPSISISICRNQSIFCARIAI